MALEDIIRFFGIDEKSVVALLEISSFHHKKKTAEELTEAFTRIATVYECTLEAVKKAVLTHPQFVGYDHERVVREKTKLGRIAGFEKKEVIELILRRPIMAGYSKKRYLAAVDISRVLERQGYKKDRLRKGFLAYYSKSPYVPGTRLRISKVPEYQKPPLMIAMENYRGR